MSHKKNVFLKNKIKYTLNIDKTIVKLFLTKILNIIPFKRIFNTRQLSNFAISFVVSFIPAFSWMQTPIAHANEQSAVIENQHTHVIESSLQPIVLAQTVKEPEALPEEKPAEPIATPAPVVPTQEPVKQTTAPARKVSPTIIQTSVQTTNRLFIWPVANNMGEVSRGLQPGHTGIDIWSNSSPYVVAMAPGTVTATGWENGGGGFVVRVKFDNGFLGLYAHTVGNFLVAPGQRVNTGQALATMGASGNVTGIHLHIELYDPSGRLLNGLAYFSK